MKSILAIFVLLLTVATISAQTHNVTRGSKPSTSNSSSTTIKSSSTTSAKKSNATISSRKSVGNKHQSMAGSSASSSARTYTSPSLSAEKRRIIDNIIRNMVYVSGGTFTMGANSEQEEEIGDEIGDEINYDETPTHQVTLSSFSIGRHEVTQEEWKAVMGSNPSEFVGAQLPVENVSWNDCQKFIKKLNAITGKTFRLPTEAEWEFAARGGNKSKHYEYSGSNDLDEVAWYYENSGDKKITFTWDIDGNSEEDIDEQIDLGIEANHCKTHQIMKKKPNELGIYDMSGNISEWCSDWYGVYSSSRQVNPKGASSGSSRVIRGGNLINLTNNCRVSSRGKSAPDNCYSNVGFRLAF